MDWKVTATSLFCDALKRWVPIMVYRDGRTQCGYYYRHGPAGRRDGRGDRCEGPESCSLCEAYRQDVFQREKGSSTNENV